MRAEEIGRKERAEEERSLANSYELLNLCKETLKEEGETWQVSRERRELEREKDLERRDRLDRAKVRKNETLEKIRVKEIQLKITETLKEIPSNRRKIVEAQVDKERLLDLKEAKQKIWRKWRQNKGKKIDFPIRETGKNAAWEEKLKKIEREVEKYKVELENAKKEDAKRAAKLEKKKRKLAHWEMMKWVISFIEENKERWDRMKQKRRKDREEEAASNEWKTKTMEEKILQLQTENMKRKTTIMEDRESRLEEVRKMKENWKRREAKEQVEEEEEELPEQPRHPPEVGEEQAADPFTGEEDLLLGEDDPLLADEKSKKEKTHLKEKKS